RTHNNNHHPPSHTDRKSQVTLRTYDALDRLTQVTFQGGATIAYTWDAGNRVTQLVDSVNGTITRTWDDLDRLTQEVTPTGTINYTYDAAGRRSSMTILRQTPATPPPGGGRASPRPTASSLSTPTTPPRA